MKVRFVAPALLAVALLALSSSSAFAGLFSHGCSSGCCEPACGAPVVVADACCEPVACCPAPRHQLGGLFARLRCHRPLLGLHRGCGGGAVKSRPAVSPLAALRLLASPLVARPWPVNPLVALRLPASPPVALPQIAAIRAPRPAALRSGTAVCCLGCSITSDAAAFRLAKSSAASPLVAPVACEPACGTPVCEPTCGCN